MPLTWYQFNLSALCQDNSSVYWVAKPYLSQALRATFQQLHYSSIAGTWNLTNCWPYFFRFATIQVLLIVGTGTSLDFCGSWSWSPHRLVVPTRLLLSYYLHKNENSFAHLLALKRLVAVWVIAFLDKFIHLNHVLLLSRC